MTYAQAQADVKFCLGLIEQLSLSNGITHGFSHQLFLEGSTFYMVIRSGQIFLGKAGIPLGNMSCLTA